MITRSSSSRSACTSTSTGSESVARINVRNFNSLRCSCSCISRSSPEGQNPFLSLRFLLFFLLQEAKSPTPEEDATGFFFGGTTGNSIFPSTVGPEIFLKLTRCISSLGGSGFTSAVGGGAGLSSTTSSARCLYLCNKVPLLPLHLSFSSPAFWRLSF